MHKPTVPQHIPQVVLMEMILKMFISERSKTQEPDVHRATTMFRLRTLYLYNKRRQQPFRLPLTGVHNTSQCGLTSMTMAILTTAASIYGQALRTLGAPQQVPSLCRQR